MDTITTDGSRIVGFLQQNHEASQSIKESYRQLDNKCLKKLG